MAEISGKLAAKIKQAIEADGRSLYALCQEAGMLKSRKQLGLFMRGESDMTLTVADRLCQVLGLELKNKSAAKRSDRAN